MEQDRPRKWKNWWNDYVPRNLPAVADLEIGGQPWNIKKRFEQL